MHLYCKLCALVESMTKLHETKKKKNVTRERPLDSGRARETRRVKSNTRQERKKRRVKDVAEGSLLYITPIGGSLMHE